MRKKEPKLPMDFRFIRQSEDRMALNVGEEQV
jgi:hypothetical protein